MRELNLCDVKQVSGAGARGIIDYLHSCAVEMSGTIVGITAAIEAMPLLPKSPLLITVNIAAAGIIGAILADTMFEKYIALRNANDFNQSA